MTNSATTIQKTESGQFKIIATREYKGVARSGEALLKNITSPAPANPPHAGLAASRAWLGLGSHFMAAGNFEDAAYSLDEGIKALGEQFASFDVSDDTDQKIALAREMAQKGNFKSAATVMQTMLELRHKYYLDRYADDVE